MFWFKKKKNESKNLVSLRESRFRFSYSKSPDKRFLICWIDGDLDAGTIGSRNSGKGNYIVFENDEIIFEGEAERPNDCKIANNGTFIIIDWLFSSGKSAIFYSYDKSGNKLVEHRFSSNIVNGYISSDGTIAVCALTHGRLAIFDLETGELKKRVSLKDDGCRVNSINSEQRTIAIDFHGIGKFNYGFDGKFIDKEKYEQAYIDKSNAIGIFWLLEEKFKKRKNLNKKIALEIISMGEKALDKGFGFEKSLKAKTLKYMGLAKEVIGDNTDAISCFEEALQLDQNIGVKGKLDSLKKNQTKLT